MEMSGAQPGWYVDPQDETRRRWWDGFAWTDASRQSGPEWVPPVGTATPRSTHGRTLVHVVGAFAYVVALGLGLAGAFVVMVVLSYNGDTPTVGDRVDVKLGLLAVALAVSSVPFVVGVIARRWRTAALPWFILAGVTTLWTIAAALSTAPVKAPTIY